MNLPLPIPIGAYFDAANGTDPGRVAACFTLQGVVRDEDNDYVGRAAIRDWVVDGHLKYSFHATPTSSFDDGETTVVTAHLIGDFPGAPANLIYRFGLTGNEIASLDIG